MIEERIKFDAKELKPMSGWMGLIIGLILILIFPVAIYFTIIKDIAFPTVLGIICFIAGIFMLCGLKILNPNEAIVLVLFGNYYGTISKEGFYFVNPFCSAINPTYESPTLRMAKGKEDENKSETAITSATKKVSLKTLTLNNGIQKVNDEMGNPIMIGVVVIWKVINPTKAVFNVDNYKTYLSIQCDTALRNVARLYPYDVNDASDEKTLRGSSQEVADKLKEELQSRVHVAGLEVCEVRITHLAYAPEIAAAMLQRQQAEAIIAARKKIVEGAVGMVEMALNSLNENEIVKLDDEKKAAMVSNLLVVLCGNKDAQPVVNSGNIN
ncbi:SPFH domain-containing protein [Terrisporobacter vanillatitrophus]|uniref:SPFH domain-containing protein n=1 Tax=Terrisporobacter vanillatitrophus TaxID=3058402 RepID=UPI003367FC1E